jgi:hypothetical protein
MKSTRKARESLHKFIGRNGYNLAQKEYSPNTCIGRTSLYRMPRHLSRVRFTGLTVSISNGIWTNFVTGPIGNGRWARGVLSACHSVCVFWQNYIS